MMKRISMLMALALMVVVAMALSGVAQASPTNKCQKEAQSLGISGSYNFIGGRKNNDVFDGKATDGADVFCGFGGNDSMVGEGGADLGTLDAGDVFLGGAGDDTVGGPCSHESGVNCTNYGTFYGEAGNDVVYQQNGGHFDGGDGIDTINENWHGTSVNVP